MDHPVKPLARHEVANWMQARTRSTHPATHASPKAETSNVEQCSAESVKLDGNNHVTVTPAKVIDVIVIMTIVI